jgi:hypothetical protein
VDLKKELKQLAIADLARVESDLDRFGVRPVLAVSRVRNVAAGVPYPRRDNARILPNQILHTPEAATREHRSFRRNCHPRILAQVPINNIARWSTEYIAN